MNARSVDGLLSRGGTILYTARCMEMFEVEGQKRAAANCHYLGIDGLICVGGDGTFRGAQTLSRLDVPCICIPATIDNDIACTDYTIGFDSACNTAVSAIDKLRDTMQSHERCSVVEVMGRRAGHLALNVGCSVGAAAILVPEKPENFEDDVVEKIRQGRINGRNHHIIIVAEGYGMSCQDVATRVHEETGVDVRVTILGHVQRGGSPTSQDRVMATRMGSAAINALLAGKSQRIIALRDNQIVDLDIEEGLACQKELNYELLDAEQMMAI
jgi:6-phosphofructokinase 1